MGAKDIIGTPFVFNPVKNIGLKFIHRRPEMCEGNKKNNSESSENRMSDDGGGIPEKHERTAALLAAASSGHQKAKDALFEHVYRELHALAHFAMCREPLNPILQTTALIHETYLSLMPNGDLPWEDRKHFLNTAAKAMRHILVDEARKRRTAKRGMGQCVLSLDVLNDRDVGNASSRFTYRDLEALDHALEKLEAQGSFSRMCKVVELLFFAGLTQEEAAAALGVSKGTVRRDWDFAKVWLQQEIRKKDH